MPLSLPVVTYSGASATDPGDRSPLWWEHFDARALQPLVGAALAAGVTPLVFWLDGEDDKVSWVRGAETSGVDTFLEARPGDPRLAPVDGWDEVDHDRGFFVSIRGEYPVVRRLSRMIRAISWGTGCSLALTGTRESGVGVLDVTPAGATKGSGIRRIAEDHGFDRVIAFGDGANDLPLFAEADESYATASASDEVKAAATAVLDDGRRGRHPFPGRPRDGPRRGLTPFRCSRIRAPGRLVPLSVNATASESPDTFPARNTPVAPVSYGVRIGYLTRSGTPMRLATEGARMVPARTRSAGVF